MEVINKGKCALFIEGILATETDDCIKWPYATYNGYGFGRYNGKTAKAHILICELVYGPRPKKMVTRHLCGNGNKGCVNPRHLAWGAHKENSEDMVRHGRSQKGEKQHLSKLTANEVLEIRKLLLSGATAKLISETFKVSITTVFDIKANRTWRHVV